jgi:hypothetical protein
MVWDAGAIDWARSARSPKRSGSRRYDRSELGLGDLDGLEQAAGLADGLLVLGARVAVVDDAAAGLDVGGRPWSTRVRRAMQVSMLPVKSM